MLAAVQNQALLGFLTEQLTEMHNTDGNVGFTYKVMPCSWTEDGLMTKTCSACLLRLRSKPGQQVEQEGTVRAARMEQWVRRLRGKGEQSAGGCHSKMLWSKVPLEPVWI